MIINCPDCGHKVSSDAPLCPYCGCSGKKLHEAAENQGKSCGCIIVAVIIFAALVYVYNAVNEQLGLGLSDKTILTLVIATVPSVVLWWITAPALYKYAKQKTQGKNSLSLLLALSYIVITGMIIFGVCNVFTNKLGTAKKHKTETIDKTSSVNQPTNGTQEMKSVSKNVDEEIESTGNNASSETSATEEEHPSETETEMNAEPQSKNETEVSSKDTTPTVSLENLLKLTKK